MSNNYNLAREKLVEMYLKSLEENKIPWEKMWKTSIPENAVSHKKYRGINNLLLSIIAQERGYKSNQWCTFKQKQKQKWKFNQDAKGHGVYIEYFDMYNFKEKKTYDYNEYQKIIQEDPEKVKDFRTLRRVSKVFNGDLIDGLANKKEVPEKEIISNEYIDNIVNNFGVKIKEGGEQAYYDIENDLVVTPEAKNFKNDYAYYSTKLHELAHSTSHPTRLNRNINNDFGSIEYAKEELRAEISSSFFMQKLNLEFDENHLKNHKAYIQSWIQIIKDKPQELFNAISDADKIVDYMEEISKQKVIENSKIIEENDIDLEPEY